jgi:hypothetical protein
MKGLGGLRHSQPDSSNLGWRNLSFRGFADYMQTPAFAEALETLIALARERPTAIMCAEAVPWRCHRYLISDALVVRGFSVAHIMGPGVFREHSLNPQAVVDWGTIRYPGPPIASEKGSLAAGEATMTRPPPVKDLPTPFRATAHNVTCPGGPVTKEGAL